MPFEKVFALRFLRAATKSCAFRNRPLNVQPESEKSEHASETPLTGMLGLLLERVSRIARAPMAITGAATEGATHTGATPPPSQKRKLM